ncbi:MAG: ATP-binding cassette domain-containing protein [Actinomycetales bacterium]|nr:ATP-binding cassette domain-containing protein [Actinomycetales bacterium]
MTTAFRSTPSLQADVGGGRISVHGAVKRYGTFEALRGVDLEIESGEFLTLLGPSGSGKTTLLNSIAGFEKLDEGDIKLDDRSLGNLPPHDRNFGMVFQAYALFPHLTVLENVAYPLRVRGLRKAERQARALHYLEVVELVDFRHRLPSELSGGQQQRVSLARAIAYEPKVLLMDEPLGALDRRLRQSLQYSIKALHREISATIICVTHDQDEALSMSDRIAVMNEGRIEQIGLPEDIYQHPRTRFVSSLLGETNFLEVRPVTSSAGITIVEERSSGQRFGVKGDMRGTAQLLSIRPENVLLTQEVQEEGISLAVRIRSRTFLGSSWRYECEIKKGPTIIVTCPVGGATHAEGALVNATFPSSSCAIFDADGRSASTELTEPNKHSSNQGRML